MTRIGFISDIHVDLNERPDDQGVVEALILECARNRLDALVIAGDIASDHEKTLETVSRLRDSTSARIAFVPGNHDVWNENHPDMPADDAYRIIADDPSCIAGRITELGEGWAAIGDLGWYDFSYGDPRFSSEEFALMQYDGRLWKDKIRSLWARDTLGMHAYFMERLEAKLDAVRQLNDAADQPRGGKANPAKRIIAVTHVVPTVEFTVYPPTPQWRYFNAFLGSGEYGELFIRESVDIAVCGHVHYRRRARRKNTEFLCCCLGYREEWPDPADLAGEIRRSLVVANLASDGFTLEHGE